MNLDRSCGERRVEQRRRFQRRAADGRRSGAYALDLRWAASSDIVGYAIEAADGAIGRVADFCLEEESLTVTEIVAIVRRQRRILVPLSAIERIDWPQRKVYLRATRQEIRRWSKSGTKSQRASRAGF
jgi:hypothetical protein